MTNKAPEVVAVTQADNFRFDPEFEAETRIRQALMACINDEKPVIELATEDLRLFIEVAALYAHPPANLGQDREEVTEALYKAIPAIHILISDGEYRMAAEQLAAALPLLSQRPYLEGRPGEIIDPPVTVASLYGYEAGLEEGRREIVDWLPIETFHERRKQGYVNPYVWLSDGAAMRVGFWVNGEQHENHGSVGGGWHDLAASQGTGPRGLWFAPIYWMPLPELPTETCHDA